MAPAGPLEPPAELWLRRQSLGSLAGICEYQLVTSWSRCVCGFISWGSVFNSCHEDNTLGSHQARDRQIAVIVPEAKEKNT